VFMDLQMPEMDGHEATIAIRGDPAFDKLPVIAMTAHAMAEERERCLREGMNDLVVKPIHPGTLYGVLREWLAARQAPAQPAAATASPAGTRSIEPALRAIAGLDVDAGLRGVLGRWPVYEDLLRRFCAGQAAAVQEARSALADADVNAAQRAVHTLRGTAGSIGATDLARSAGEAENIIRKGECGPELLARLETIDQALRVMVAALTGALPVAAPVAAATAIDPDAALQAATRLQAMLADDDADAVDFLREQGAVLRAFLGEEFAAVDRLVSSYAFPDAGQALREALLGRNIGAPH